MTFDDDVIDRAWDRAKNQCECCRKELVWSNRGRIGRGSWEAHHRKPKSHGGTNYLGNCVILCTGGRENCHLNVGHGGDYNQHIPYNGTTVRRSTSSDGCFIATAAYGSPMTTEINVLRNWRDLSLKKSYGGRVFIKIYYRVSPSIAKLVSKSERGKSVIRKLLDPIIIHLKPLYGSDRRNLNECK